jgi:hypothetical protein
VNFDTIFSFVLEGCEGSAHDGKVLKDGFLKGLRVFPGKYNLGDAGYGFKRYCLTPFRGVRYHLKEWARGNSKPLNKEELFNMHHAYLRNIIERAFGIIKKKIPYSCKNAQF